MSGSMLRLLVRLVKPLARRAPVAERSPRTVLWVVGALTAVLLGLTADGQIYDANLYILAEATALLAGDRPGRDFFWWGAPLEAYAAAAAQLASGGRLIGEFVRQWFYIVAGVMIAFHLGLRLSRSIAATLAMLVPTLVILANTPTYHAPKLLFFSLFTWVAWRYVDAPSARRAAVLGCVTALAFLTRHDYGLYLGFASVITLAVARLRTPGLGHIARMLREAGAYVAAAAMFVAPWAVSVQATEGLVEFTRARVQWYPTTTPYSSLLDLNPIRSLMPQRLPAPTPAMVRLLWQPDVDEARRQDLERQYGLRLLEEGDDEDRLRYEVPNIYDFELLQLDQYIRAPAGFEFERLLEIRAGLPSRDDVSLWLQQVALIIPLLLLAIGGLEVWRHRGHTGTDPSGDLSADPSFAEAPGAKADGWRMVIAGAFLVIVHEALFRGPGYVVVTAPLTAALSARFLVRTGMAGRACAVVVLALTTFAASVWASRTPIFLPSELPASVSRAFRQLLASPPVDGEPTYRYLYECSVDGDRVLITGATPSFVSYYANRPIAGGHSYWHHGWLSDPLSEARSLQLLERQSVPFAVSTHDPVMDDFKRYPRIRAYLDEHYAPLEGTYGTILVDTRREPTGQFGPLGYPCFR